MTTTSPPNPPGPTEGRVEKCSIYFSLSQVQKKYLSVHTTHTLYCAGLGKPEYLQWVLSPKTLITSLYNDKSVLLFHKTCRASLPDINAVTDTIAKLHGIDIVKVRQELLSEWLSCKNQMLDASLTDVTTVHAAVSLNPCEDDNFLRLVHTTYFPVVITYRVELRQD
jgi:Rough deal protein C-terminal region.